MTPRTSPVMFTNLPATGGTLRKSRILTSEHMSQLMNVNQWDRVFGTWTFCLPEGKIPETPHRQGFSHSWWTEWNHYPSLKIKYLLFSVGESEHIFLNWRVSVVLKVFKRITVLWTWHSCRSPCGEVMTYHFVWFHNHTVWDSIISPMCN